jgi:hypothetical protein
LNVIAELRALKLALSPKLAGYGKVGKEGGKDAYDLCTKYPATPMAGENGYNHLESYTLFISNLMGELAGFDHYS